ncbi:MAG: hypothetical protein SFH39_12335 [Candidatus Magnetobacterium sp. LHC-1]|nr:hypothetical protein [Nitrospirota bacterium]
MKNKTERQRNKEGGSASWRSRSHLALLDLPCKGASPLDPFLREVVELGRGCRVEEAAEFRVLIKA